MKQQDFLQLRREIIQRARVMPRLTAYQIQIERLRARQLAQFMRLRLKQLHLTPTTLARTLGIEQDFVRALLEGTFPVSELSAAMVAELARCLRCDVSDLVQAMQVGDESQSSGETDV